MLRAIVVAVGLILALGVVGAGLQSARSGGELRRNPPPGQLVDVGGRRLHLDCAGEGQSTVVLEAGGGQNSLTWGRVPSEVSRFTRVCSYDRAGLGWSDAGPDPRDARSATAELHALLRAADVPGPYVLVGHSLGGLYVRAYASRYPSEVAGIVMVDPTPVLGPDDTELRSLLGSGVPLWLAPAAARIGLHRLVVWPPAVEAVAASLPDGDREAYRATMYRTSAMPAGAAEQASMLASIDQARAAGSLGALPVEVLVNELDGPERQAAPARYIHRWPDLVRRTREYADLSRHGRHRMVARTGHFVQLDRPQVVVDSVRQMVEENSRVGPRPPGRR